LRIAIFFFAFVFDRNDPNVLFVTYEGNEGQSGGCCPKMVVIHRRRKCTQTSERRSGEIA
ncbi:hypothetical protein CEXT_277941, partial [Caerostris extrusa]